MLIMNKLNSTQSPPDATYLYEYSYYKIGIHDKLFRWSGSEWLLSSFELPILKLRAHQFINGVWLCPKDRIALGL